MRRVFVEKPRGGRHTRRAFISIKPPFCCDPCPSLFDSFAGPAGGNLCPGTQLEPLAWVRTPLNDLCRRKKIFVKMCFSKVSKAVAEWELCLMCKEHFAELIKVSFWEDGNMVFI